VLNPEATWFDFINAPGLYYLFDRPCPIPYYETGFYEGRREQEAVIMALQTNLRVKLALVRAAERSDGAVDGISNAERAPLVAAYLARAFQPAAAAYGVEMWVRRPPILRAR
jgi:hypothetical protein